MYGWDLELLIECANSRAPAPPQFHFCHGVLASPLPRELLLDDCMDFTAPVSDQIPYAVDLSVVLRLIEDLQLSFRLRDVARDLDVRVPKNLPSCVRYVAEEGLRAAHDILV